MRPSVLTRDLVLRAVNSILNRRPVACSLFVTNRCNFSCTFCEYPSFNNRRDRELTVEQYGALGEKLAASGVVMVAMIGGEPLVRKDIAAVVRVLAKHVLVQITTNGWFVDETVARELFAAGAYMVNVSLDSSDPDQHNAGRRNRRAYERALEAAKILRDAPRIAADQCAGFESILSGRNIDQIDSMARLARELGVHIVFQPFSRGHVENPDPEFWVGPDHDPSEILARARRDHGSVYNHDAMIEALTPYFRDEGTTNCQAGVTCFNLDAYGHITRCEEQRRVYGDLLDLDVPGIRDAWRAIHEDTLADGCSTCYLRTRGETEPLYRGRLEHFFSVAPRMFNFQVPWIVPLLARVPGFLSMVRHPLGRYVDRALSAPSDPGPTTPGSPCD